MQNIRGKFTFSCVWFNISSVMTCIIHTYLNKLIIHFSRGDAPIIGHMLEYCSNLEYTLDSYDENGHCSGEATANVLPQRMKWEISEPVRIKYRLLCLNCLLL